MHVCMYIHVCMYMYVCVCMYVYICTDMHIHTYINIHVHTHSGIIIDGFGELRDKENEAKEYREETSVICGVSRHTMEQV